MNYDIIIIIFPLWNTTFTNINGYL